jgi:hypothetical protein
MVVGAGVVTAALAREGSPLAIAGAAAAVYFALRASGRIGPKDGG